MAKEESKPKRVSDLRKKAKNRSPISKGSIEKMSSTDVKKLMEELKTYQIELEIQNEALRESRKEIEEAQHKYADLFVFAPIGYFTLDEKGRIIEVNAAGASMLGLSRRSLVKQTFKYFITPGHRHIFASHLQHVKETTIKQTCDLKLARKDGSLLDALIETVAVTDSEDRFDHYQSMVSDITERKRAEEALRESEERFRAIFEGNTDGMIIANPQTTAFIMGNQAICRMLGCRPEEIPTMRLADIHRQEDMPFVLNHFESVASGRKSISKDIPVKRKDGSVFLADVMATTITMSGKTYLLGSFRDITERKRAEETLRKSEERFRQLADSTFEGIVIHDKGIILDVNQALTRLTGYDYEEAIGKSVFTFIAPESKEEVLKRLHNPSAATFEIGLMKKDGIPCLVEATARDISYKGKTVRVVALHDITEHKRAEEELIRRQTLLEEANKDLESFSYSVSHDLRAPLRAIDGYARMILKKVGDKFDEDTKRKFNDLRLNAQMMGTLIDDLLAFSRLGRKDISRVELNMVDLIREEWEKLNNINPDRKMYLIINNSPLGYGDAALIKQVYYNFLSNAVKFTKLRDYAQIEVGGYNDGNEDVFYVKDNGIGFDMKYCDKLFGVFQRLHNDPEFEGTGVGLATVQRIISRHGGRVWAEGKVGEGATFYFSLPYHTHTTRII